MMASVTRCDVCGNIAKHEECIFMELYTVTPSNKKDDFIMGRDLCPACKEKLMKFLKEDE